MRRYFLARSFLAAMLALTLATPGSSAGGSIRAASSSTAARSSTAAESISVVRQTCAGYGGAYPCYTSLAAWAAAAHGDLVAADKIAVARIEGAWTAPDTTPLDLSGWTTDATHYVRLYTAPEARHHGVPSTGYRLETSSATAAPLYSTVAYLRIEGLELYSHSAATGSVIYLNPNTAAGVGEIWFSHNLIHGDGMHTAGGLMNYSCQGTLKIWDNIIFDVGTPGYTAGIQTSGAAAYIYNNTIASIISGFAIRAESGQVVAKNNLTDAPGSDFYGSFYPGSDFNASGDATAPGGHSRRNQTFTFVNQPTRDLHLAPADKGAAHFGQDLSSDAALPFADDVDGDPRSGGWDIGADQDLAAPDTVPPVRFNLAPAGTLISTTTQVSLTLNTSEAATCRYGETPGVAYAAQPAAFTVTGALTHTAALSGLTDDHTYTYYVRCQDLAANANPDDEIINFYIASADTVPPVISGVQVTDLSQYTASVRWNTDEAATAQVEFGATSSNGQYTVISATRMLSHTVTLAGLEPGTAYHFRVRSRDVADNETVSAESVFTTSALSHFYYVNQKAAGASDSNPGTEAAPWLTIQHAADMAQPGDTILVLPGDYGRVAINHGGAPGQFITFKGVTVPDRSLVQPDAAFDPHHPVMVPSRPDVNAVTRGFAFATQYTGPTVSYVRVENFEITRIYQPGVAMVGRGGVYLRNTQDVEIVRNFLHDLNPNPTGYDYIGIRGDAQDNVGTVVKDNTLYRVQGTGIVLMGRDWLVEGNDASHGLDTNTDSGLEVGGDSDAVRFFGSGHVIRNNYFHDNLDTEQTGKPHIDCFQTFSVYPDTQYADHILVEGNTCRNMGQMLMVEDSSEAAGTGDKVHHLTFRNNVFIGARAFAMQGSRADYFTFVNNVVAQSNYGAIGLTNCPHSVFANNIFYLNGSGAQIDQDSMPGTVWDYNLHYPDFSWPPKQPAYDQHSLFGADPRLVSASSGDFHLQVNSPALDRGMALVEFNYDKDLRARPQLAGWDMGAYEAAPELALSGWPASGAVGLAWGVNFTLPVTSTWQVAYSGAARGQVSGLPNPTRTYTLAGLANSAWYTVTLSAMLDATPLISATVRVRPSDHLIYLPGIAR